MLSPNDARTEKVVVYTKVGTIESERVDHTCLSHKEVGRTESPLITALPGVNVVDLYYEFDDIAPKFGDGTATDTGREKEGHRLDTICIPPREMVDFDHVVTYDSACSVNEKVESSTCLGACPRDSDKVVWDATLEVGHGEHPMYCSGYLTGT